MSAYISGFSLGLSFILAIGSQNAFVLKQGIRKQYVFLTCLVCAVSASFTFFFSLGYGARLLSSLFKNPKAWKVLEFIMLTLALSLVTY